MGLSIPQDGPSWVLLALISTLIVHTYGGCEFKSEWAGKWFLSGVPTFTINNTWIESKGACIENSNDKYVIHDIADNCYRCMVIHEKHPNVLQYKETYCDKLDSLDNLCNQIAGDAILYSMFRVDPQGGSVSCPFKGPPFTFTYSRGVGECGNPVSRVDSCTDESKLSFKYQACPDVHGTESTVEELQCLAVWKDGSTRYMVGKLDHHRVNTDEDSYRCFVYEKVVHDRRVTYNLAQSGDATCNGLTNAQEGSKTIKLTKVENSHVRCKYPNWITDHHKWHTLDYSRSYHFSLKNGTLRITDDSGAGLSRVDLVSHSQGSRRHSSEMRMVCHAEELNEANRTIVSVHVTSGCDSGYLCLAFYRRDPHVIEYQQSNHIVQLPEEACRPENFNAASLPFTTLITGTLPQRKCPHLGQYNVLGQTIDGRSVTKRSEQVRMKREGSKGDMVVKTNCNSDKFDSVNVGCTTSADTMEFHSWCNPDYNSAYSCYGSWEENGTHFLIASPSSRKSTEARRYCFVVRGVYEAPQASGTAATTIDTDRRKLTRLMLSAVADTCDRSIMPGITGIKAFNLTITGQCANTHSPDTGTHMAVPSALLCIALLMLALSTR